MTLSEAIPLVLGGGIGMAILLTAKAVDLIRKGTDVRQRHLIEDRERDLDRAEHNARQHENRWMYAEEWIRKARFDHPDCDHDLPPYSPPKWERFEDPK